MERNRQKRRNIKSSQFAVFSVPALPDVIMEKLTYGITLRKREFIQAKKENMNARWRKRKWYNVSHFVVGEFLL